MDGDKKIDWKFKPDADPVATDDFWYDVTDGGYIHIVTLLSDGDQVNKFNDAIDTLLSFKSAALKARLLELM